MSEPPPSISKILSPVNIATPTSTIFLKGHRFPDGSLVEMTPFQQQSPENNESCKENNSNDVIMKTDGDSNDVSPTPNSRESSGGMNQRKVRAKFWSIVDTASKVSNSNSNSDLRLQTTSAASSNGVDKSLVHNSSYSC